MCANYAEMLDEHMKQNPNLKIYFFSKYLFQLIVWDIDAVLWYEYKHLKATNAA